MEWNSIVVLYIVLKKFLSTHFKVFKECSKKEMNKKRMTGGTLKIGSDFVYIAD
jgi:hypothetical protein